eukprot:TRINITY_DN2213_c3_g1_i1.p1 TRINITY_DN2213_c3_g1~~TRINITY_DN2213_c3_g1_i1.p1  ORF type:complete len:353 (+),score=87.01 TRINITY_DN2213_c3_g1_i1:108-1166(+)
MGMMEMMMEMMAQRAGANSWDSGWDSGWDDGWGDDSWGGSSSTGKGKGKKGKSPAEPSDSGGGGEDSFSWMLGMALKGKGKGPGLNFLLSKGSGKAPSKAATKVAAGDKVYHGKFVRYSAERTSGFIWCKDIWDEHFQEVYVFKNVVEKSQCEVGDDLAFFVHWSGKGQPQASSPILRLSSIQENNLVLKGVFRKASQGYGFIECNLTTDFFGRDVYVSVALAQGLETGQLVAFNCSVNRDGNPQANMICACDETYHALPGDLSQDAEAEGYAKGKGKYGKGNKAKGKGKEGGKEGKSGGGKMDGLVSALMGMVGKDENVGSGFGAADQEYDADGVLAQAIQKKGKGGYTPY